MAPRAAVMMRSRRNSAVRHERCGRTSERSHVMSQQDSGPTLSGWAVGGITFAVTMMIMIGVFQVIAGLVAIFDDDFYVVTQNYTFDLDTSAWGWIHLLLGALLLLGGYFLSARAPWA